MRMMRNYFKTAVRILSRQKVLALINVSGLLIGIGCFCLFLLYAIHEFSYDRFHLKADRIFRVAEVSKNDAGKERGTAGLYMPLGPAMKKDFPDVESFARFNGYGRYLVRADHSVFNEPVAFADPELFSIFSFRILSGNPADPLRDPHSIVLTRQKAIALFGSADPVGKTLEIKIDTGYEPFRISAIAEDIPTNSSIGFDILGSFEFLAATNDRKDGVNSWRFTYGDETYVLLKNGSRLNKQPERMTEFRSRYVPEVTATKVKPAMRNATTFELRPLRESHTSTEIDVGEGYTTDPKNIWILIGISSAILLIACINFTTLAIGRSAGRAKEVGIRKVIGGHRKQLAIQFLTESLLLSVISTGLGFLLANLLLPLFNRLCGRDLRFSFTQFPELLWMLAGLMLLVGIVAGSYPALILSGFRPVEVLKSKIRLGGSNLFTRSLVTVQFLLSIGLIISTLVIFRQLEFMRSKNLGFDKEHVIVVRAGLADPQRIYAVFEHRLESHSEVMGVASSSFGLGKGNGEMNDRYFFHSKEFFPIVYPIDPEYLPVMGMQLVAGRNFDSHILTDSSESVVVNEELAAEYIAAHPADAVGQQLVEGVMDTGKRKTIIGVVKDFNFEPLTRKVRPQLFTMIGHGEMDNPSDFFVRIRPGDPGTTLAHIKKDWDVLEPGIPFRYSFLDEDLDHFYDSEKRWSRIVGWAGGISIFLACLGLFGLAALAVVNRTQEIGIRKVLGASIPSIVLLISRNFLQLVLVAIVLAAPLAWYFMHKWLDGYAYRIPIGWEVFAITGFVALCIALLTVGMQAIRAGAANPVKTLRVE